MKLRHLYFFVSPFLLASCAQMQGSPATPLYEGYLCCNIHEAYNWLSDSNYGGDLRGYETYTNIPVGMPVKVMGYGRERVQLEIEGKKKFLGNDYSRTLPLEEFAKRWIWTENPRDKMAQYPVAIQRAIASRKIMRGMTREQVAMSLGYPIASQTPDLNGKTWYYYLRSNEEFRVFWGKDVVKDVYADPETVDKVLIETK